MGADWTLHPWRHNSSNVGGVTAGQVRHNTTSFNTVVPVMNGNPRDQAKVSVHCRWPLIRGTGGHVDMSRDIDNVAVNSRWPLTTGVAQGRYHCNIKINYGEL